MSTYTDGEQSPHNSAPIELVTFETPSQKWYLTQFNRDISGPQWDVPGNVTYVATPGLSRSSLPIVTLTNTSEVSIDLPFEHVISQTLLPGLIAIRRYMKVTILRVQANTGGFVRHWQGFVNSVNVRGRYAGLRISNGIDDRLMVDLPGASVSVTCNHVLYDDKCRVNRASFSFATAMSFRSGQSLVVSAVNVVPRSTYYDGGEIIHPTSTERRTITSYPGSGTTFILEAPFPEFVWTLDSNLILYAGCDHSMPFCVTQFNNRLNFGGSAQLPTSNPFRVTLPGALPRT